MEEEQKWLTPKEIAAALGPVQCKKLVDDLAYERKERREILDDIMRATSCAEYSATDFIRELLKDPGLAEQ